MGVKVAPSVTQNFGERAFSCHRNAFPFLDDITVRSEDDRRHLKKDLPLFLAISSYYGLLLKGSKADLMVSKTRVLGFDVSPSSISLSKEKEEKIRSLEFPSDKKGMISALAFFSYFLGVSPKLSEYLAPLRRFGELNTRFTPTEKDREVFEMAKTHLLDPCVGALRFPSAKAEDRVFLFTDASKAAFGAILTQMQPPIDDPGGKKHLTVIGVYSATIPRSQQTQAIWVLELISLYNACRKWASFLLSRSFIIVSDNSTVLNWSNLTLLPADLARKVLRLQSFNYKVLYVSTTMNPADIISRQCKADHLGVYPRFLHSKIVNSEGKSIPVEKLFSAEKQAQMETEFVSRRQALVRPVSPSELKETLKEEEEKEEEEQPDVGQKYMNTAVSEVNVEPVEQYAGPQTVAAVYASVAVVSMDDDDMEAGRSDLVDEEITEDVMKTVEIPNIEPMQQKKVRTWQKDGIVAEMKTIVQTNRPTPSKLEALALPPQLRAFWTHRSLFVIKDDVLWRGWTNAEGEVMPLIVVSDVALKNLMREAHEIGGIVAHQGARKLFQYLAGKFWTFQMRRQIGQYVSSCPTCTLANHPRTKPEKHGERIALQPNQVVEADFVGPLNLGGPEKYLFLMVDSHTRYAVGIATKTSTDEDVLKGLNHFRRVQCGLPQKLQVDGALLQKHSKTLAYLKAHNVSILHGLPRISRCQGKVERLNGSILRLLLKLQIASPKASIPDLLQESLMIYNSSPHSSLPLSYAPRDLHFVKAGGSLIDVTKRQPPESASSARKLASEASRLAWQHELQTYLRKKQYRSPTDFAAKLRVGDYVLRKRTSFPTGASAKACYKTVANAYEIETKLATNAFRVKSIIDNTTMVLPGDHLLLARYHTRDTLRKLVEEMKILMARSNNQGEPRMTRKSSRLLAENRGVAETPTDPSGIDRGVARKTSRSLAANRGVAETPTDSPEVDRGVLRKSSRLLAANRGVAKMPIDPSEVDHGVAPNPSNSSIADRGVAMGSSKPSIKKREVAKTSRELAKDRGSKPKKPEVTSSGEQIARRSPRLAAKRRVTRR